MLLFLPRQEMTEQREQNDACINYVESWGNKTKSKWVCSPECGLVKIHSDESMCISPVTTQRQKRPRLHSCIWLLLRQWSNAVVFVYTHVLKWLHVWELNSKKNHFSHEINKIITSHQGAQLQRILGSWPPHPAAQRHGVSSGHAVLIPLIPNWGKQLVICPTFRGHIILTHPLYLRYALSSL